MRKQPAFTFWHIMALAICAFSTWAVLAGIETPSVEGTKLKSLDRKRQAEEVMALCQIKHPNEMAPPDWLTEELWRYPGSGVIFGRVKMENTRFQHFPIGASMGLAWPHGYFMAITDYKRPVEILVHGYQPLIIDLPSMDLKGDTNWIGEFDMPRVTKETGGTLRGRLVTPDSGREMSVPIILTPLASKVTSQMPGDPHRIELEHKVPYTTGTTFVVENCTPYRYEFRTTSREYIDIVKEVEFKPGQTVDLGNIELQVAPRMKIQYRSSSEPLFEKDSALYSAPCFGEKPAAFFEKPMPLIEFMEAIDFESSNQLVKGGGLLRFNSFTNTGTTICDLGEMKEIPNSFDASKCKMVGSDLQNIELGHVYVIRWYDQWLLCRITKQ